jgi:ligand-binding sensor domain-containing protein
MNDLRLGWLVGAAGLFHSPDGTAWHQVGEHPFRVTSILRTEERTCVGTGGGVWEVTAESRWLQLHDETVTEVLDLDAITGDPGLIVASAYGVAVGARDGLGAVRWSTRTDELAVDERFTNIIAVDPANDHRWLVGTEAGLLVSEDAGRRWTHSSLIGTPVRGLCHALGDWWAGTDNRGLWRSSDGLSWRRAGRGLDESTVFALTETDGRLLAGTSAGAVVGDGNGWWQGIGPKGHVGAVAAHPQDPDCWMIGLLPGGLWMTTDGGRRWRHAPELPGRIEAILAPEGRLT